MFRTIIKTEERTSPTFSQTCHLPIPTSLSNPNHLEAHLPRTRPPLGYDVASTCDAAPRAAADHGSHRRGPTMVLTPDVMLPSRGRSDIEGDNFLDPPLHASPTHM